MFLHRIKDGKKFFFSIAFLLVVLFLFIAYFFISADRFARVIYDSIPIIVENKTEYDWLFIFLPYAEYGKENNSKGLRITLPPLISEARTGDVAQQYFFISGASKNYSPKYGVRIYWWEKINVEKFLIIALGWKIKDRYEFNPVNISEYCSKHIPDKVLFLKNKKYLGMRHDDYQEFAKITLIE